LIKTSSFAIFIPFGRLSPHLRLPSPCEFTRWSSGEGYCIRLDSDVNINLVVKLLDARLRYIFIS